MLATDLRGGKTHNTILSSSPPPPSPSQFSLPFLGFLVALHAEDFSSPCGINAAAFAEGRRQFVDHECIVHEGIYADDAGFFVARECVEMLPVRMIVFKSPGLANLGAK